MPVPEPATPVRAGRPGEDASPSAWAVRGPSGEASLLVVGDPEAGLDGEPELRAGRLVGADVAPGSVIRLDAPSSEVLGQLASDPLEAWLVRGGVEPADVVIGLGDGEGVALDEHAEEPEPAPATWSELRARAVGALIEALDARDRGRAAFERTARKERGAHRRRAQVRTDAEAEELGLRIEALGAGRTAAQGRLELCERDVRGAWSTLRAVMAAEELGWSGRDDVAGRLEGREADLARHPAVVRAVRERDETLDGFDASSGLGSMLATHAGVYAAGRALLLLVALAQALVTVQFLAPGAYGQVAVVATIASFVALVLRLVVRRGALSRTFGRHAGDDDDGDDGQEDDEGSAARDPRRSLGTGIVLMALAGLLVTAVIAALRSVLPDGPYADLLAVAGVLGALNLLFDTVRFIPMMERRPMAFVLAGLAQALFALGGGVLLLASGAGPAGLLLGQAAGTACALLLTMVVFRHAFVLRLDRGEVGPIVASSRQRWVRIGAHWVLRNEHLLLLAALVPSAGVGGYRLASQVTLPLAFPFGAFFQAWLPLERAPLMLAANNRHGRERLRGLAITYCVVVLVVLLLCVTFGLRLLRLLVPGAYDGTLQLIPWLLAVAVAQIALQAVHRFGRFAGRRRTYDSTLVAGAVAGLVLSYVGIRLLGVEGAALGCTLATGGAALRLLWATQRGDAPLVLEGRKLALTCGLGLACFVAADAAQGPSAVLDVAVDVAAPLLLIVLLCVVGVVPAAHRRVMRQLLAGVGGRRPDLLASATLAALDDDDREALRTAVARRAEPAIPLSGQAPSAGAPELAGLEVLRRCARTPPRSPEVDGELAAWAFGALTPLDRHHLAFRLYRAKIPPEELAVLDRWRVEVTRGL